MDNLDRLSADKANRDWFTISVDTLRAWGVLALVLVLGLGAYGAYRRWNQSDLERRAKELIAEASNLRRQLEDDPARTTLADLWRDACEHLDSATVALNEQKFEVAVRDANWARNSFVAIDGSSGGTGKADATFGTVVGNVEFRRGQSETWQEARQHTVLYDGDRIRSHEGTAEVRSEDGTQYTLRPHTQLVIRAKSARNPVSTIGMEYGWVDLATTRFGSQVETPTAEARVADRSEAMVTYDADTKVGRFAAFRGGVAVKANAGEERAIAAMEQVTQRGDRLSAVQALPPAPELDAPADRLLLDLDRTAEVQLRWSEPATGAGYGLEVARDRLFNDKVLEVPKRTKPSARLGLRAEGTYYWRVQSINGAGVRGPWSAIRMFRVHKDERLDSSADTTPPELHLEKVRPYGNIFLIGGRTEPGCTVRVNGEPVDVSADGSFTKTIQIDREGWNQLEIRARDAAGNEVSTHRRVLVEIP